jgi:hypothetical protein
MKFPNALIQDIKTFGDDKGLETVQSVPIAGKLYYWWFGKGARRLEEQRGKEQKKAAKENKEKSVFSKSNSVFGSKNSVFNQKEED